MTLLSGANQRLRRERDLLMGAAWQSAALPKQRRFPSLKAFLGSPREQVPQRQDWRTQAAILEGW